MIVMLLYFKRESHAPFYATALLLVLNQIFPGKRAGRLLRSTDFWRSMAGRLSN